MFDPVLLQATLVVVALECVFAALVMRTPVKAKRRATRFCNPQTMAILNHFRRR